VKSAYDRERRLLRGWARWCDYNNEGEIMRACGLSRYGSPPNTMQPIYIMGERKKEDVTGFAPDPSPLPDTDSEAINEFMTYLRPILPDAYYALLARHRRIIHGEQVEMRSDGWIARAMYCLSESASYAKLNQQCNTGYQALQRWWNEHNERAA
jgi:hypothetical protein